MKLGNKAASSSLFLDGWEGGIETMMAAAGCDR